MLLGGWLLVVGFLFGVGVVGGCLGFGVGVGGWRVGVWKLKVEGWGLGDCLLV